MNARRPAQTPLAKWLPVGAAGGLLAAVVVAGVISGGGTDGPTGTSTPSTAVFPDGTAPITSAPISVPTASYESSEESTETVVKVPLGGTVSNGSYGDDVTRVQSRLAELAFDPGPVDGAFGKLTTQAVWAFEKLIMGTPRAEAKGVVTPEIWDRMQDPFTVKPRRPTGGLADHTEIYLPEQVLAVFHADKPVLVAHISTGELAANATAFTPWYETADEYCETVRYDTDIDGNVLEEPVEKQICGRSYTPPGVFTASRKVEGVRNGPLGGMFDPIYINQGIAIHGAKNIPLEPASHGCIRVSQHLGKVMQTVLDIGDKVLIWDGVTEPENQSAEAMKMRWDYPDPNATTTTSTTTTTTTTTTVVPTTVPAAAPTTTTATPTTVAPTTVAPTTVPSVTTTTVVPVDDL